MALHAVGTGRRWTSLGSLDAVAGSSCSLARSAGGRTASAPTASNVVAVRRTRGVLDLALLAAGVRRCRCEADGGVRPVASVRSDVMLSL